MAGDSRKNTRADLDDDLVVGGPEYAGLSDRHRKFLDHYYQRWNAGMAARHAGYGGDDKNNQAKYGHALLNRADIQAALKELQYETSKRTRMTLDELGDILEDMARDETSTKKDRQKAIELRTRMKGGFLDKQDINLKGAVKLKWAESDEDMSWLD